MKKGKVYLVGAGPGDPRLITVKGLELIKKADVIIYDFLINKELLSFAKKKAELIDAGKSYLHHSMEQEQINKLLAEKAMKVKVVVRLKSGDPFIFGRGAEEAAYLVKRNISCEVVPGLTSAIAVPVSCGVPLTHRDYASSVAIVTGHGKKDSVPVCGSGIKTVNADTLVFLMAVTNLEKIVKTLIRKGKSADTPCILIEKGTSDKQKVVQGSLADILEKSKGEIKPPAVFVVGKVVGLRDILNNQKKVINRVKKKILFTGTNPHRFKELGELIHQPMIKVIPLDDYSRVEKTIEKLDKYHWIIFTSQYGVKYFFDILNSVGNYRMKQYPDGKTFLTTAMKKIDISHIKICVIGQTTAAKLKEYGIKADCVSQKETSRGIIETLKKFDLKGKNVLIPRSNLSNNYLPNALRRKGASVKAIIAYKNIRPSGFKKTDMSKIDEVIFTSPSAIKNFMDAYKTIPKRIKIKCIGGVTLAKLKTYGFSGEVL
ncbi:MAG: uroporphyrinogen-III C-methyltransferase [Candidatus Omnitrophica bacterium]|nr:uroporphyrinogen-III C-methyltransferase [Candidatus Omnitrophota bacterium]